MNLLDEFIARCNENPNRVAIVEKSGREWTYSQILERAKGLAINFQASGLKYGDRVLVATGFNADLYASLAAIWWLGAVVVFPEPALGINGVKIAIETVKPRAILLGGIYNILPFFVPEIKNISLKLKLKTQKGEYLAIAGANNETPALISFTTGSTGRPKAIIRSHGFMRAQDKAVALLIGTNGRHEIDLVGFPIFVVANLGQGISSVLPNWPIRKIHRAKGKNIANLIKRKNVTRLLLSPEIVARLAEVQIPDCVHSIFTGGGPVFPDLILKIKKQCPDLKFIAVYGSTEAEPIAEIDAGDISDNDYKAMNNGAGVLAGYPVSSALVRVVDDEIQVSGEHVVKGYFNPAHDSETKVYEYGILWHRTGDAGYFDDKGRLWLLGRLKGRVGKIWPFSVEIAAKSWKGVKRAALISLENKAVLVIEGDNINLKIWHENAKDLGIDKVIHIKQIPMDRRHGSKIDMLRLNLLVKKSLGNN